MTDVAADQIYCSVDLEFTGFDPSRDQILEIGFAFFKVSDKGFEVIEQWSQVFKPSIEVHPKILGLTGITQQELDSAPEFSEHREFLQEKLGSATIVGHNPVMDVKFLEGYGIKLSGKVIDTLELVQFILPTHHSYNLENLVHFFGIKHSQAHRALGDAISTINVLENLVQTYQQFTAKLKNELEEVMARGDFLWRGLLATKLPKKKLEGNDSISHSLKNIAPLTLSEKLITIDSTPIHHEARVALGLMKSSSSSVLAVPSSTVVMRLWKEQLVHGIFRREDTFSKVAFNRFLKKAQTQEELRFCLKVIVWLRTNWQTEVVLDLNISFFGGQFRSFIVGGKPRVGKKQVLCLDYLTLQALSKDSKNDALFSGKQLVVCDMQNFEKFISSGFGTRLSWGSVLYSLKVIYNPETDFGNMQLKDEVVSALTATDLFFGLVYMLLHQAFPINQYVTLDEINGSHAHIHDRLKRAAVNLAEKLKSVIGKDVSGDLGRTVDFLQSFFVGDSTRVKWITLDERNLTFHDQPIDISENVRNILKPYDNVRFTETITTQPLLSYLVDRLGLDTEMSELPNKLLPHNIHMVINDHPLFDAGVFEQAVQSALPLVIVFPLLQDVKNFYNKHYVEIKENAALFAQGYSGGGNKMFRNFSIKENSVLLVTADFMSKQNYSIPAQTVIFIDLPPVEVSHPYTAALLSHWQRRHKDLTYIFSFAKVAAVLKKVKIHGTLSVKMFGEEKNIDFVDKLR